MTPASDDRRQGAERPPDAVWKALPCIACGKPLESVSAPEDGTPNHPYKGTVFTSHGHYGSTAFDPMPLGLAEEYLEITICDDCLRDRAHRVLHATLVARERKRFDYESWNPDRNGG